MGPQFAKRADPVRVAWGCTVSGHQRTFLLPPTSEVRLSDSDNALIRFVWLHIALLMDINSHMLPPANATMISAIPPCIVSVSITQLEPLGAPSRRL